MRNKGRRWRRAMWKAIQAAAGNEPGSMYVNRLHPIHGLRAIRDFERINKVTFDPHSSLHLMHTNGMGRLRSLISAKRQIFDLPPYNPLTHSRRD